MTRTQRRMLAVGFGVVLAVAIGVIAAGANPDQYLLTLAVVAGVLVAPMAVLGWFGSALVGAEGGRRGGHRNTGGSRTGGSHGSGSAAGPDAADQASGAAWRDTVIVTGAVLIVVAFVGVQWRTSYVLLGVLIVAMLTQAARQAIAVRR